jgi:hypothetical protein
MSAEVTSVKVTIKGVGKGIMFDRFMGMNNTDTNPEKKFYVDEASGLLHLPSDNIVSFLSSQNTESATKRVMGKLWKTKSKAALSFVSINPDPAFHKDLIVFIQNKKTVTLKTVKKAIVENVARIMKGALCIPSPKIRPVLLPPWELNFVITYFENEDITVADLKRIFDMGGLAVGLGSYRGVYGKFEVSRWEIVK